MPPPPPGAFPLTHLWFLYYLLMLYALVLLGRAASSRSIAADRCGAPLTPSVRCAGRAPAPPRWRSRCRSPRALYFRTTWIAWFGVPTPDQSLIPRLASFVGFGTAFAFGWLVHRQPDLLARLGTAVAAHLAPAR